ncbi:carboxymuconolactone decarboxylase family protein [Maribacter sp. HTCC2170]|uniref:carboxymuconolactone decarboxylase family protein n=1 Tax=Maribacter sp. (strain HTCC2170 / KCCM 42371) TaxID=313603 RepID=UPI00006BB141|nr:carboxymuconolactone decarboxylase family protein [Maribacter sp. HTCC2170]EAQ99615.1 probable Mip protein [Maribacter sp. HTCC2170]
MNTLNPLKEEEANENSKAIFSNLKSKIGMVPNLYATMGVSDKLLGGYLTFVDTLKSGEFSNKEYEAIALATSQANNCAYCLSAHTAIGKMNGFSEEETLELRSNSIADNKLNVLVTLVSEFIESKGHPTENTTSRFFEVGYTKAAFAELIAAISMTTITNYVYHNGGFEIDFPKAQGIENLQTV